MSMRVAFGSVLCPAVSFLRKPVKGTQQLFEEGMFVFDKEGCLKGLEREQCAVL